VTERYDWNGLGWDVHVDYITATSVGEHPASEEFLVSRTLDKVAAEWCPADEMRPRSLLGYVGRGNATIFEGARHDGRLVRVSGVPASAVARVLVPARWRASRIDVALDVKLGYDPDPVIRAMFEEAWTARDALTAGFKKKIRFVDGAGDGDTLYIGARTSRVFFRAYNKYKESQDSRYKDVLRLEAQFNGPSAGEMHTNLGASAYNVCRMAATVCQVLARSGLAVSVGAGLGEYLRWHVAAPSADEGRQVKWLRAQVGPVARRLKEIYGEGFVEEVLGI